MHDCNDNTDVLMLSRCNVSYYNYNWFKYNWFKMNLIGLNKIFQHHWSRAARTSKTPVTVWFIWLRWFSTWLQQQSLHFNFNVISTFIRCTPVQGHLFHLRRLHLGSLTPSSLQGKFPSASMDVVWFLMEMFPHNFFMLSQLYSGKGGGDFFIVACPRLVQ